MKHIRLHAVLASTLLLVGCYSVRYEYVELSADNIEVTDLARPDGGRFGIGKARFPRAMHS